jgi:hypothetical protein
LDIGELAWQDIPDSLESGQVILRPLMFAGLDNNLEYAQKYEETGLTYNKSPKLTGYRTAFPCFFV